ncbi:MAG: hypothetical protein HXY45_13655 [Syntrophaceae bacterium]|nr:hypothetical protein [Syntrophaceae bacterium]
MKENQPGVPVITHCFASEEIRPGDTWKLYLRAEDSDGDMKNIICHIRQPGRGSYPVCFLKIPEGQRRELSGFLFLNTAGSQGMAFINLALQIEIQDRAGNTSLPISLSLSFNPRAEQENPPLGVFREEEIGPIMASLEAGSRAP